MAACPRCCARPLEHFLSAPPMCMHCAHVSSRRKTDVHKSNWKPGDAGDRVPSVFSGLLAKSFAYHLGLALTCDTETFQMLINSLRHFYFILTLEHAQST